MYDLNHVRPLKASTLDNEKPKLLETMVCSLCRRINVLGENSKFKEPHSQPGGKRSGTKDIGGTKKPHGLR